MQFLYAMISVVAIVTIIQPLLWIIGVSLYVLGAIMRKEKFWD